MTEHEKVLQAIKSVKCIGDFDRALLAELLDTITPRWPPYRSEASGDEVFDRMPAIHPFEAWDYLISRAVKNGWKRRELNVFSGPVHEPEVMRGNLRQLMAEDPKANWTFRL